MLVSVIRSREEFILLIPFALSLNALLFTLCYLIVINIVKTKPIYITFKFVVFYPRGQTLPQRYKDQPVSVSYGGCAIYT